ncbi:MAG: DUF4410 domain-containing protein [Desulfovibrionaceae bacterium]|nr:DUF4410 domain-containing protein [Desulfovibrionaceae bacterium]MBF0514237.1 DUF4410 domain-containing protein [Desulfovibrionaceae bacterium]
MSNFKLLSLLLLLCIALTTGCAGSRGSIKAMGDVQPAVEDKLASYKYLSLQTSCAPGVQVPSEAIKRIEELVVTNVAKPGAPRMLSAAEPDQDASLLLTCQMVFERFEEGNAFARAMIAGAGQMHITASVSLLDTNTRNQLAQFKVDKTFAWGGIYGASQKITDLEPGFAQAVADAITGRKEEKPKSKE